LKFASLRALVFLMEGLRIKIEMTMEQWISHTDVENLKRLKKNLS
jgi:hypothetical protein